MSDVIDRIMQNKADHVAWLKELFAEMQAKGFNNIRLADPDLERLTVEIDGADAVIREMFQIDDVVVMRAMWPREEGRSPWSVQLSFLLCNDAWESLMDHSIPCEEVMEVLSEITNKLAEKYE